MPDLLAQLETALTDRYRIEWELGRGGMAVVYLAHDRKLGRDVALKVLRPELAASLGTGRFLREIEIAAALNHPNILPLFDRGEAAGQLYFTMPYVEGESLRDRLDREKQLPIDTAIQITREVADALGHAHAKGLVHRDIKPENILLTGGHALLADFGIARAVGAAGADRLTETGLAVGTPAYMSPEQASGSRDLDARSDLYSLGCVLYEMLAGEPPYTAPSAQGIVAKKLGQPTPRISVMRETVPDGVDAALERVLANTPADRFATAVEFREALSRGATLPAPVRRPTGHRVVAVLAAVAAILALLGAWWATRTGLPGTLIGSGAIDRGASILLADFGSGTGDTAMADAVVEGMRALLADSRLVHLVDFGAAHQGLARMGKPGNTRLDESLAGELAERVNATAYVTGDVSRLGTGYQLTARVVATVEGQDILIERATANDERELLGAVDRLGRRLRRGIGESVRDVAASPSLLRVSAPSLPALRAYSSAVRTWPNPQAIGLLQQAVALDTTFAAAYWALSGALGGMSRPEEAKAASEAAYRHRDHLTEGNVYSSRSRITARAASSRRRKRPCAACSSWSPTIASAWRAWPTSGSASGASRRRIPSPAWRSRRHRCGGRTGMHWRPGSHWGVMPRRTACLPRSGRTGGRRWS
jgi:hypothetical protein